MTEQNFAQMRAAMVTNQLRTTGVNDPRVVEAMRLVPRERFVSADRRAVAYADALVPLGGGRALNPPMVTGLLLTEAALDGHERVLVVGAATGYSAAVAARLAGSVIALEELPELAASARETLAGTGVVVVEGPLAQGHAAAAPYDFILIDGAVEEVPQAIVDQVAEGGEIGFVLLDAGVSRLALGRVNGGALGTTIVADAAAAILPGFERPRGFSF
jgi:protein-L-isoaspartate(D-aspartate) O-methyltransferase